MPSLGLELFAVVGNGIKSSLSCVLEMAVKLENEWSKNISRRSFSADNYLPAYFTSNSPYQILEKTNTVTYFCMEPFLLWLSKKFIAFPRGKHCLSFMSSSGAELIFPRSYKSRNKARKGAPFEFPPHSSLHQVS